MGRLVTGAADFDNADTTDFGDGGLGDTGFGADVPHIDGYDEPPGGEHPGEPEPDLDLTGEGGSTTPEPMGYGDALADEPFELDGGGEPDAQPDGGPDAGPDEPEGAAGFGAADDAPVGADPDLNPHGDDPAWHESPFPAPLDLAVTPEPVDGFPWTDAAVLGDGGTVLPDPAAEAATGTPQAGDLFAYAGEDVPAGGANWTALAASPDPATSTLARFWAPDA